MNEINPEVLKRLKKLVEKRIKLINANIASNQEQLQRVNRYDDLVDTINNDNKCFANDSFLVELEELLGGLNLDNVDKSKLELLFEKVELLKVIAESIINGYYKDYTKDEFNLINDVIELIQYFKHISHEQKSTQRSNVSKSNEELVKCESLYDKLRNGEDGTEHFDEDLSYIMLLTKEEDISFRKDVLVLVQALSKRIHENKLKQIEEDVLTIVGDELDSEEEKNEVIDEDLIRGVFAKYGFNYDFFTEKHKNILSRISLIRVESVLEVLSSYPEYQFVRDYQKYGNERNLFLIIRYATKETLLYLIQDAKNRGVTVEEIFGVSGVYKKVSKNVTEPGEGGGPVDEDYVSGTYEYYKKNADLFERLSLQYNIDNPGSNVDFYKDALLLTPEVLALPSQLLAENIQLVAKYKLKMVKKTTYGEVHLNAATMYESRHFEELCDVLIENGLYDYVVNYPSVIKEEKLVKKILYAKRTGTLERLPNGKIRDVRNSPEPYNLNVVVNRNNLNKYYSQVPDSIIEFVNNPDNKKLLSKMKNDSVMDSMDANPMVRVDNEATYAINGVLVSRHKFRRIWYLMTMSGHMNEGYLSNLLMYALIYNSYYTDVELKVLEEFARGFNFGGVSYGILD